MERMKNCLLTGWLKNSLNKPYLHTKPDKNQLSENFLKFLKFLKKVLKSNFVGFHLHLWPTYSNTALIITTFMHHSKNSNVMALMTS